MTHTVTTTFTKPPLMALMENLIAVDAAANERLLAEARKTAAVKTAEAEQAKKVNAAQAAENASLKAQIVQLKAQMEQMNAANSEARKAEREELVTKINAQQKHITYLGGRVDRHVREVNHLRGIFFYQKDVDLSDVRATLERAHHIV